MAKRPYLVQVQEDHPFHPGWWRYSRPVLKWLHPHAVPPLGDSYRYESAFGFPHRRLREECRRWDASNPRG